ncbi:MAG TPA: molybdate ABC transporter permease subunit [Acidobacteriaceae bacterium]|jgi:molybdate transport system permease protein|nr:molybdate ABC transporter permease subunit [Acidobacteriaceae bacterium]
MDLAALGLTLRLAAVTTLCLLILGTPLAIWISARNTLPRKIAQAAVALPLVLPPTVLGFYLLVWLGPVKAPGRLLIHLLGHPLAFTFTGLVVGSILYSLPFAVQPLVLAFSHVDPNLTEVAATLGASPFTIFRRVVLPLSRNGFLTAAVLTFAHTVGEFGVVLMIGGDIPGLTRTLSISIFDQVQELNYRAADRTALLLIAISFLALLVTYWRSFPRETGLV